MEDSRSLTTSTSAEELEERAVAHAGPCAAERHPCSRPDCRQQFGDYRTVEVLRDARGRVVETRSNCHRDSRRPDDDPRSVARRLGIRP
jgi:hypothetical protein